MPTTKQTFHLFSRRLRNPINKSGILNKNLALFRNFFDLFFSVILRDLLVCKLTLPILCLSIKIYCYCHCYFVYVLYRYCVCRVEILLSRLSHGQVKINCNYILTISIANMSDHSAKIIFNGIIYGELPHDNNASVLRMIYEKESTTVDAETERSIN